ncbi:MAG: hypothetical protein IPK60_03390 [Sandaracinaceae bacterium]|nr:hypothetical protein [Sandaracinaceae bacterium]
MRLRVAVLTMSLWTISCGGSISQPPLAQAVVAAPTLREGIVRYEARSATPRGASVAREIRPARFVDLEAQDPAGQTLARATTDERGHFSISMPSEATSLVLVLHSSVHGHDVAVTRDPNGLHPHTLTLPLSLNGAPLETDVSDLSDEGIAGGLHILDTMIKGLDAAVAWSGRELPPLFVYWGRGVTTVWSFYRGERPAGSHRYALELMGGERGRLATTDADDHDEAIMLHELGHFVFDRLSSDSSAGGMHPGGVLLDPGVAWEEGRATWFATAVLGAPWYRDTIGLEPQGSLRVDENIETDMRGPVGLGSEIGVSKVLWDLTDGVEGIADVDNDGISLGPAAVLRSMIDVASEPGAFPSLSDVLRNLVKNNAATRDAVHRLLAVSGQPPALLPDDDRMPWPLDIGLPGLHSSKIDGVSNPAPSGGRAQPENGFDSMRAYRVHVTQPGFFLARLTILGTGRAADHQDLDLELRDIRATRIAVSNGETPLESVGRVLMPGYYILYVRDGGNGNQAPYELSVVMQ